MVFTVIEGSVVFAAAAAESEVTTSEGDAATDAATGPAAAGAGGVGSAPVAAMVDAVVERWGSARERELGASVSF